MVATRASARASLAASVLDNVDLLENVLVAVPLSTAPPLVCKRWRDAWKVCVAAGGFLRFDCLTSPSYMRTTFVEAELRNLLAVTELNDGRMCISNCDPLSGLGPQVHIVRRTDLPHTIIHEPLLPGVRPWHWPRALCAFDDYLFIAECSGNTGQSHAMIYKIPDGDQWVKGMTTTQHGRRMGNSISRWQHDNFNKNTGRLYTLDQLLPELIKIVHIPRTSISPEFASQRKP